MASRIDDLKLQAIKREYCNPDRKESNAALAKRMGISEGSLKRYAKAGGWNVARQMAVAVDAKLAEPDQVKRILGGGGNLDIDGLLVAMIDDLRAEMGNTPCKSKEGAARAVSDLLKLYDARNPMTMPQLADFVLGYPGFDAKRFAQALRELYPNQNQTPQVSR